MPAMPANAYEKLPEFEFDDARFDQPPLEPVRMARRYVICSTHRTGSWLLCRQLVNAGIGVPSEYFNVAHLQPLCDRWRLDPRDTSAYLHALYARRTTSNGVWGTKLHGTQLAVRRAGLKVALFRDTTAILLHREDIAAQAVSSHLSQLTGAWDFTDRVSTRPRTDVRWGDPSHLAQCDRAIRDQNRGWRDLFATRGIHPLVVRYEDLIADQPGTIARIAELLGLGASDYRRHPPEPRETPFPPEVEARRRDLVDQWRTMRASASGA